MNYHPVKFGGHRHSFSGHIVVLVSHMMSKERVIKEPCDFMSWNLER